MKSHLPVQGLSMLEQPFAAKAAGVKEAVARMLTSAAATHGCMEAVVGGIASLLGKHDHMGPLAAELCAISVQTCREDALVRVTTAPSCTFCLSSSQGLQGNTSCSTGMNRPPVQSASRLQQAQRNSQCRLRSRWNFHFKLCPCRL